MRSAIITAILLALPTSAATPHTLTEEVRVASDGVALAATLCLPADAKPPYPAAVAVHGSGRMPRQRMRYFCDGLNARGIAVLIYDKRGAGESGGVYSNVGVADSVAVFDQLSDDALAGVNYLRGRKDIDAKRIGLIGNSQAGWIIPLAATKRPDLAFIVLISGPSVSVGEEIYYSDLTGEGRKPSQNLSEAEIEKRLAAFKGPHGYEPRPVLEKLTVPSLWLLGAKDESIPAARCLRVLQELQRAKRPIAVKVYPNGDHGLQDAATGARIPYWSDIYAWLEQRGIADQSQSEAGRQR